MKKHKYNIFPEASTDDFQLLLSDMEQNGYDKRFPIVLFEGEILDGWNRWKACKEFDVVPITEVFYGTKSDAINYTMRSNKRRNLSSSQWAAIAVKAEDIMAGIAEETERERREKQAKALAETHKTGDFGGSVCGHKCPQTKDEFTYTATKAATMFNTSPTYIKDAKRLKATRPEAFEDVFSGKKTITEVKKAIKTEKRQQERTDKIEAVTRMSANDKPEDRPLPSLVLADPPWQYRHCATDSRKIENQYETAEHDDIKSHSPKTANDCLLLMWVTAPKLSEGINILESWGFDYRTCAVWDKEKIGMGYWFRGEHELLLVGVKGKVSPPEPADRVSSMFRETRTQHSKKPDCVYEWIESAFPEHVKLEMYCRNPREGWQVWGNEV